MRNPGVAECEIVILTLIASFDTSSRYTSAITARNRCVPKRVHATAALGIFRPPSALHVA